MRPPLLPSSHPAPTGEVPRHRRDRHPVTEVAAPQRRRWVRRLCYALCLLGQTTMVSALSGQVAEVRGRVVDEARRAPLADATVFLLGSDGSEVATAATGSDGFFRVSAGATGSYVLRIEVRGYATAERSVELGEGELLVPAFVLEATAIPVAGVEVEVDGRTVRVPVEERSARPANVLAGEHLAELERSGVSFTSAVQEVKGGVRIRTTRLGGPGTMPVPCIESHRTLPRIQGSGSRDRSCQWVAIVIDGVNTGMDGTAAALFVKDLRLHDWESIQILEGIDAMRYGMGDSGALVLWTRGRGPYASNARDGGSSF